jgi:hypothetical protein
MARRNRRQHNPVQPENEGAIGCLPETDSRPEFHVMQISRCNDVAFTHSSYCRASFSNSVPTKEPYITDTIPPCPKHPQGADATPASAP